MKKLLMFLALIISVGLTNGQTQRNRETTRNTGLQAMSNREIHNNNAGNINVLFTDDFTSSKGWSTDKYGGDWSRVNFANAGGKAPEEWFFIEDPFNDTSKLISPVINTTGLKVLNLKFKQAFYYYLSSLANMGVSRSQGNPWIIGVATRSKGGPWTVAWSKTIEAIIDAEDVLVPIKNSDVGQSTFQFAFFFQGNVDDGLYWAIDNVFLEEAQLHDVSTVSIAGAKQYAPNATDTVKATIQNFGADTENLSVVAKIFDYQGNTVFTNTKTVSNLAIGAATDIVFDPYVLSANNTLYKVQVYTNLPGDLNTANDTVTKYINTYTTNKNLVVVEISTSTGCYYCPGAQMGADDLCANGKNVAVIEYHVWDDLQIKSSGYRYDYYGMVGCPTTYFDGTSTPIDGTNTKSIYPSYLPFYEKLYAVKTPLAISVTATKTDEGKYSANINIKALAPYVASNVRAFLALTESKIPLKWEGQSFLDHVERLLLPDTLGRKINLSYNEAIDIPLTFTIDSSWAPENIELVAWLQNYDTKEIYNGAKTYLPSNINSVERTSNTAPSVYSVSQNYPNPFNPSTTIEFSLPVESHVKITVYNTLGQKINNALDETKPAGNYKLNYTAANLSSGLYFYSVEAKPEKGNSIFKETKKMLLLK